MRGHVLTRSDTVSKNLHYIVLELDRDAEGKRKRKTIPFHGRKKDAEKELVRLLNDMHNGMLADPARLTVADLLDRWLKDCARPTVAATTFERYEGIIRDHLKPALGHVALSKLRPLQIQKVYTGWQEKGSNLSTTKKKSGLAPATIIQHHRVLRKALNQAVKWQLVPRNVADAVEVPKTARKEMSYLGTEDIAKLLKAAENDCLYLPVLLALTTGMRRGEIMGLRWSDVDLENGALCVRQSLASTKAGLSFKSPKTKSSVRSVPLMQMTVTALKQHRKAQAAQKLLCGADYSDNGLVNALPDGSPWPPDAVSASFRYLVRRAGVPVVRFHDLRHSHATWLMAQNVHPKVVSERLGHSGIAVTMDLYSHVGRGMQEEAVGRLDADFEKAMAGSSQKPG